MKIWIVEQWYCGNYQGVDVFTSRIDAEFFVKEIVRRGDGEEDWEILEKDLEVPHPVHYMSERR